MNTVKVVAIACFSWLGAHLAVGSNYRFSEQCSDDDKGVVVFTRKVGDKLHLFLNDLTNNSTKDVEIDNKASTPVLCGGQIVVCLYGAHKVVLFDYQLRQISETETEKDVAPFYSACGSNGKFLYVYVVKSGDKKIAGTRLIYKYAHTEGSLAYLGSAEVGIVGKLVEFGDSLFAINATNCERVNFPPK